MSQANRSKPESRVVPLGRAVRRNRSGSKPPPPPGEVAFGGAGPGDPELLTVRASKLLGQAEVLIYDRLVGKAIVELAPASCEKIFVGKRCGQHALSQDQINALMVRKARDNKRVVRLKGGDPFIFGRGAEEIKHLSAHGVSNQVVPGITAASGCTTAVGIPLTNRDNTQMCTFVTGHLRQGRLQLPWQNLAAGNQTVVFYMGLGNAEVISSNLRQHGRDPQTPVALIEQGTTAQQRLVISNLEAMTADIALHALKPPTLIVIGEVVDVDSLTAPITLPLEQVLPE